MYYEIWILTSLLKIVMKNLFFFFRAVDIGFS